MERLTPILIHERIVLTNHRFESAFQFGMAIEQLAIPFDCSFVCPNNGGRGKKRWDKLTASVRCFPTSNSSIPPLDTIPITLRKEVTVNHVSKNGRTALVLSFTLSLTLTEEDGAVASAPKTFVSAETNGALDVLFSDFITASLVLAFACPLASRVRVAGFAGACL